MSENPIRVTVWGENLHEKSHEAVKKVYPNVQQTSPASSLAFANLADGAILSGDVEVVGSLPKGNYEYGDITLSMDKDVVGVGGDGCRAVEEELHFTFPFSTKDHANGPHRLTLIDKFGNRVERSVRFQN